MKSDHLISVIIPVYNGESYLKDAIQSILKQKYTPIEIIVVDDGSTDRSQKVAKGYEDKIKYFLQTNNGTAAARNFGIEQSSGNYLSFLDQDDLWTEDKLRLQLSLFEKNNNLDIVFGLVKQFYSPETDDLFRQNTYCPSDPMPGYLPSSMVIKRESFFRVGFFESKWQIGEWADWYARAVEKGLKMFMPEEVVALRRIHNNNKGIVMRRSLNEYLYILKGSLDRRRT